MSPKGFQKALSRFARRRPFRKFVIELLSGDCITVRHPEVVRIGETLIAHVSPQRHVRFFECSSVCQVRDVIEEAPIELHHE